MKEIWKDVKGYEGLYRVSNLGRVKSLERVVDFGNQKRTTKENIRRQSLNGAGYLTLILSKCSIYRRFQTHQLVAEAFLGHEPCGFKLVVDHINFDKLDNRVENLRIISTRENLTLSMNRKKSSSKYVGVHWNKKTNKWVSRIYINNKRKYLGSFNNEIEASNAYQKALKEI